MNREKPLLNNILLYSSKNIIESLHQMYPYYTKYPYNTKKNIYIFFYEGLNQSHRINLSTRHSFARYTSQKKHEEQRAQ